mgnify:CR=1 FL=1
MNKHAFLLPVLLKILKKKIIKKNNFLKIIFFDHVNFWSHARNTETAREVIRKSNITYFGAKKTFNCLHGK